jgi:hypothetical protein
MSDPHAAIDPHRCAGVDDQVGTVNLSGRVSRMQAIGKGHWKFILTNAADFRPDLERLSPGSSMLGGSNVIAAEMKQVVDLIVG